MSCESHLCEDTLAEVADLRARGNSWDATARHVGWGAAELRRAVRGSPEFTRHYEEAAREVRQEVEAEMLLVFRNQLRDPEAALKAAGALAKHLAGERRDRTRLEVERLRADAVRAKAEASRPKVEDDDPPLDMHAMRPEDIHDTDRETDQARRATDTKAVVWLWGGAHKLGAVEPDPATDVPLVLFADHTNRGRHLYWAARYPIAGDWFDGPFPIPGANEPVPDLTAEQADELAALAPRPAVTASA